MRLRGLVAYDGTHYHGWARQPGEIPTVQGALEGAFSRVLRTPVSMTVAGRTDAGVHAWGQVVSFDVPGTPDLDLLSRSVNRLCGPAVSIRRLGEARADFDARHDATSREYVYRLMTEPWPHPFLHRLVWHVARPLDVERMGTAAQLLVGEHDFATFCKKGSAGGTTRRVLGASVAPAGDGLVEIGLRANAFCHQMVRSIVGLLVQVGLGKRAPDDAGAALAARDRGANSVVAPPGGLTLWSVSYADGTTEP